MNEPVTRPPVFSTSPGWTRVLLPLSHVYGRVAAWRRHRVTACSTRLEVPVVSVGNLTVGGTGKTPAVEWVTRRLSGLGRKPAILSRGYGRPRGSGANGQSANGNDEFLVLLENLPDVPHIQNPSRVKSGREAIAGGADVLVLDDGFQHFALHRDLDIVLIDAVNPFGFGRVLPAGMLREPLETLEIANLIVVTRGSSCHPRKFATLKSFLKDRFPRVAYAEMDFEPRSWVTIGGEDARGPNDEQPLENFRNLDVVAFCGIGNPEGFRRQLERLELRVLDWLPFRDHYRYTQLDLERIAGRARELEAAAVIMTQKDAVKVRGELSRGHPCPEIPWSFLSIEPRVTEGEKVFERLLEECLTRSHPQAPNPRSP